MDREYAGLVGSGNEQIALVSVKVKSDIVGAGARTKICHEFGNTEHSPIEAVYKFPLPENAAICNFRAIVGDKVIRGEIAERDKAFEIYDDAITNGHGAFLLDEERPNIFTLSIGSLKPGASAIIEIEYINTLDAHSGELRYLLPTTISPRYIPRNMEDNDGIPESKLINPPIAFEVPYRIEIEVNIFDRDNIASLDCPSHSISTAMGKDRFTVTLSGEMTEMDRDFILNIKRKNAFGPIAYEYEINGEHFCQIDFVAEDKHLVSGNDNKTPHEVIFLLDCSGSMQGSSIEEAKRAISIILRGLEEGTLFNIYRFGSTFTKMFPISEGYSIRNAEKALAYVEEIDADLGGTEIYAPLLDILQTASEMNRSIVLLTDGEVGNETEIMQLASRDGKRTRIFTVGIGHGPNEYFIRQLSRATKGASELIAPNERIEPKVLRLYRKVMSEPIVLSLKWEGNIEYCPPEPLAYPGELLSIFGRAKDNTTSSCETVTVVSNKSMEQWQIPLIKVKDIASPMPQLWARAIISEQEEKYHGAELSGSKQAGRKNDTIKEKIVALSEKYRILSRLTSFVGVEVRADSEKSTDEVVLRKIPVMLTKNCGRVTKHSIGRGIFFTMIRRSTDILRAYDAMPPMNNNSGKKERHLIKQKKSLDASDRLMSLLNAQRAEGGFFIDSAISNSENLNLKEIRAFARKISCDEQADTFVLVCTAIVIAILNKDFSERRDEWEGIAAKSINWLKTEIDRTNANMERESLDFWAKDYVKYLISA